MRRPPLKSLPTFWRKAAVLALFLGLGVAADRLVIFASPIVYRVVSVRSIHGTKDRGCTGSAGDYLLVPALGCNSPQVLDRSATCFVRRRWW